MPDSFSADLRSRRRENPIDRNGNIGSIGKKQVRQLANIVYDA